METTKEDVEVLLENFDDYVNPAGDEDPWFTLVEINQQFAWEDVPRSTLVAWLSELVAADKVAISGTGEYRWLS